MGELWRWQEVAIVSGPVPVSPVEDVVLDHEEDVEEHREETQAKFRRVAEDWTPILVVVGEDEHLRYGKRAAREVQEDVADAPAWRALAAVVVVGLGKVGCDSRVFFSIVVY